MTVAQPLIELDASYARAVPRLSVPWTAAPAPAPELLLLNTELADELGLDAAALRAPAGVALLTARATDAIFPKPRIAPQVPRGAAGVVLGAMLGTLASAGLGSVLVLPFTPAKGAVIALQWWLGLHGFAASPGKALAASLPPQAETSARNEM